MSAGRIPRHGSFARPADALNVPERIADESNKDGPRQGANTELVMQPVTQSFECRHTNMCVEKTNASYVRHWLIVVRTVF